MIQGPFRNEAEFKKKALEVWRAENPTWVYFALEDAENNKGAPDVFSASSLQASVFYEFKFVGPDGVIRFQKDQPLWYKRYAKKLHIKIVVWDSRDCTLHVLGPDFVTESRKRNIRFTPDLVERSE